MPFPFHLFFRSFYNCNYTHQTIEINGDVLTQVEQVYVISKSSKLTKRSAVKRMNIKKMFKCQSENVECTVCCCKIDKNEYIRELPCGHQFHKKCVDEWLFVSLRDSDKINCPLCRRKITMK